MAFSIPMQSLSGSLDANALSAPIAIPMQGIVGDLDAPYMVVDIGIPMPSVAGILDITSFDASFSIPMPSMSGDIANPYSLDAGFTIPMMRVRGFDSEIDMPVTIPMMSIAATARQEGVLITPMMTMTGDLLSIVMTADVTIPMMQFPQSITAEFGSALPSLLSSLVSANNVTFGNAIPSMQSAITGALGAAMTVQSTAPSLTGGMNVGPAGAVTGIFPSFASSFTAYAGIATSFDGVFPGFTSEMDGEISAIVSFGASLPMFGTGFAIDNGAISTINSTLPKLRSGFVAAAWTGASLSGTITQLVSGMQVIRQVSFELTSAMAAVRGGMHVNSRSTSPTITPTNIVAPAITGTPRPGETLTTSIGTWVGTAPITYTYQWYADAAPISGQTANTYAVPNSPGEVGKLIHAVVTATNGIGSTGAAADAVEVMAATDAVALLNMPMTGTNGSTTFTDAAGGTWSATGDAAISTALTAGGDLLLDGSGDYVTRSISVGEFSLAADFSIRWEAFKTGDGAESYDTLMSCDEGSGLNGWVIELSSERGMYFYNAAAGGAVLSHDFNPNDSTWHAYELRRVSGSVEFLIDDVVVATSSNAAALTQTSVTAAIGAIINGTYPFAGHIKNIVLEVTS